MFLTEGPIDLNAVDNVWAAIVALTIVIGFFIYYTGKKTNEASGHAKRAADAIEHETQPNSGKSLKDGVDRLEAGQTRQTELIEAQGRLIEKMDGRISILEQAAIVGGRRRRSLWR